jgi:hypothetical protein
MRRAFARIPCAARHLKWWLATLYQDFVAARAATHDLPG